MAQYYPSAISIQTAQSFNIISECPFEAADSAHGSGLSLRFLAHPAASYYSSFPASFSNPFPSLPTIHLGMPQHQPAGDAHFQPPPSVNRIVCPRQSATILNVGAIIFGPMFIWAL
jgi:hypothetical protein